MRIVLTIAELVGAWFFVSLLLGIGIGRVLRWRSR